MELNRLSAAGGIAWFVMQVMRGLSEINRRRRGSWLSSYENNIDPSIK
jgi:hypothetical protein